MVFVLTFLYLCTKRCRCRKCRFCSFPNQCLKIQIWKDILIFNYKHYNTVWKKKHVPVFWSNWFLGFFRNLISASVSFSSTYIYKLILQHCTQFKKHLRFLLNIFLLLYLIVKVVWYMYMDLDVVVFFLTPAMLFSKVARFYISIINRAFIQIDVSARIFQCLTDVLPFIQRHVVFSISFGFLSDYNISL